MKFDLDLKQASKTELYSYKILLLGIIATLQDTLTTVSLKLREVEFKEKQKQEEKKQWKEEMKK